MPHRARQRRSPARYLAPVALLATVAGVYVIVHTTLATKSKAVRTTTRTINLSRTQPTLSTTAPPPAMKTYVVRPGDTLDLIAAHAGVSVQTIEALNPGVSATELRVGQRLILRR